MGRAMICLYSSGIKDVPCSAYTVAVLIGCAMICLCSSGINRMCHDLPIQ